MGGNSSRLSPVVPLQNCIWCLKPQSSPNIVAGLWYYPRYCEGRILNLNFAESPYFTNWSLCIVWDINGSLWACLRMAKINFHSLIHLFLRVHWLLSWKLSCSRNRIWNLRALNCLTARIGHLRALGGYLKQLTIWTRSQICFNLFLFGKSSCQFSRAWNAWNVLECIYHDGYSRNNQSI